MSLKFDDLSIETKQWIAPELRTYFDQITFENREDWLMCYRYGASILFSSFEMNRGFLDYEKFDKHKYQLFVDGLALYKINNIETIELVAEMKDESHRYLETDVKYQIS